MFNSFGVVLIEQKPISFKTIRRSEKLGILFLAFYETKVPYLIFLKNDGPQEEIIAVAKLAKRCLNQRRPTMKKLERIRTSRGANAIQQSGDDDSDIDDMIEPWAITSCLTRSIINNTSVTSPS
ncbi:hypothetical protein QQP08_012944, partial [Theobroma cacao]